VISANVRRLVLDPAPLWPTGIGLLMWAMIGLLGGVWATGRGAAPNILMVFPAGVLGSNILHKVRTWQILPLSQSELRQAQLWCLFGRPYLLAVIPMAFAVGVDIALGALGVSPVEILAFVFGEITLLFLIGIAVPLIALIRQQLSPRVTLLGAVPYLVAAFLVFHWGPGSPISANASEMLWCGGLCLIATLAAYVCSPWIPLALPAAFQTARVKSLAPSRRDRPSVRSSGTKGSNGRSLFTALFARIPLFAVCLFVIVPMVILFAGQETLKRVFVSPMFVLLFTPWLSLPLAVSVIAVVSQRMLGGLPLSAFKRTLALQLISPVLVAFLGVLMIAVASLLQPQAMTVDWWLYCGLSSLATIAISASALPTQLRFGQSAFAVFAALIIAHIGVGGGVLAVMGGRASGAVGLFASSRAPVIVGFLIALMFVGWIWTYVELAYGRRAYQQRPTLPTTWRGAAG
jgi:hypothetical protein